MLEKTECLYMEIGDTGADVSAIFCNDGDIQIAYSRPSKDGEGIPAYDKSGKQAQFTRDEKVFTVIRLSRDAAFATISILIELFRQERA